MLCIAELLPEGDLDKPATSLSVEWFYMTFHKSNMAEYVCSGHKLCEETPHMLTEYFELIYDSCLGKGLVPHHQLDKIQANAKREMRHELQEQYDHKLRHFAEQRRSNGSRRPRQDNGCCQREYDTRRDSKGRSYDMREKKGLPPCKDKGFKPCHVHGEHARHSYKECCGNPRNQANKARGNNYNKCAHPRHESHYHHDARYVSSNIE